MVDIFNGFGRLNFPKRLSIKGEKLGEGGIPGLSLSLKYNYMRTSEKAVGINGNLEYLTLRSGWRRWLKKFLYVNDVKGFCRQSS